MGKQGQGISQKMLERITEHAAKVAIDVYDKERGREEKERFDRRRSNTRLLLEHYRDFSAYEDNAIFQIYEKLDEDVLEIIELMDGRRTDGSSRVESIEKGVMRTRAIMNHVNVMLEVYEQACKQSPYPEEMRRYRVIEGLYLSKTPKSVQEIAEAEGIAERTVYKDVAAANRRLTALIFGIDGFKR